MGFSADLSRWLCEAPNLSVGSAKGRAKLSFIDTIGCMIGGSNEPPVRAVLAACGHWGAGPIGVVGTQRTLPLPWAALVNGTSAHALDYDDNLEPALGHASAVLVPALLCAGAALGSSGSQVLDAYIAGVEVMGRLGLALNMDHYAAGWHTTVTLGAPAAAAGIARLSEFDVQRTNHALSIATSMVGGSKVQFGTGLKPVHAGLAAKAGIVAAGFAEAGLDAAADAVEGSWGIQGLMNGPVPLRAAATGEKLIIESHGLMRKLYPCCAAMHRAIDGVLELRRDRLLDWRKVGRVRIMLAEIQAQNLPFTTPANPSEARFSLQYCVASAMIDGQLDLSSFSPDALRRANVRELSSRIEMSVDPSLHGQLPPDAETPTTLRVDLMGGSHLETVVRFQPGHERRPLSDLEIENKFRMLVGEALLSDRAARLLDMLHDFERCQDVGRILSASSTA